MNAQIQRKQIVMLVLSIVLAGGSYWIPLRPHTPMLNLELPEIVAQSTPVESGILVHKPVKAWWF